MSSLRSVSTRVYGDQYFGEQRVEKRTIIAIVTSRSLGDAQITWMGRGGDDANAESTEDTQRLMWHLGPWVQMRGR